MLLRSVEVLDHRQQTVAESLRHLANLGSEASWARPDRFHWATALAHQNSPQPSSRHDWQRNHASESASSGCSLINASRSRFWPLFSASRYLAISDSRASLPSWSSGDMRRILAGRAIPATSMSPFSNRWRRSKPQFEGSLERGDVVKNGEAPESKRVLTQRCASRHRRNSSQRF